MRSKKKEIFQDLIETLDPVFRVRVETDSHECATIICVHIYIQALRKKIQIN